MTHPFKFGDRVRVKDSTDTWDEGVVLDTYGDNEHGYFAVVCFEHYDNQDFRIDEIEPVPHPDTVRLDWIGKQRATLYHNAREDIKHGIAPVEVKAAAQSEYLGGSTVRQAIDTAMREKAAEAV